MLDMLEKCEGSQRCVECSREVCEVTEMCGMF